MTNCLLDTETCVAYFAQIGIVKNFLPLFRCWWVLWVFWSPVEKRTAKTRWVHLFLLNLRSVSASSGTQYIRQRSAAPAWRYLSGWVGNGGSVTKVEAVSNKNKWRHSPGATGAAPAAPGGASAAPEPASSPPATTPASPFYISELCSTTQTYSVKLDSIQTRVWKSSAFPKSATRHKQVQ